MRYLPILLTFFIFFGCKIIHKNTGNNLSHLIKENFGESAQVIYNESGTHLLCLKVQVPSPEYPSNQLYFGIIDVAYGKIIYKEQKYNANVSWVDDVTIQVKSRPGVRSTDEQTNLRMALYYINVNTLEKSYEYPKQDD